MNNLVYFINLIRMLVLCSLIFFCKIYKIYRSRKLNLKAVSTKNNNNLNRILLRWTVLSWLLWAILPIVSSPLRQRIAKKRKSIYLKLHTQIIIMLKIIIITYKVLIILHINCKIKITLIRIVMAIMCMWIIRDSFFK